VTGEQNAALARIARAALDKVSSTERAEFKEWSVEPFLDGILRVRVVAGMTNDAETLASVFCRYRGTFYVGIRGGIRALVFTKGRKMNARKYPLIYGFES
jgi:hypothetical protein